MATENENARDRARHSHHLFDEFFRRPDGEVVRCVEGNLPANTQNVGSFLDELFHEFGGLWNRGDVNRVASGVLDVGASTWSKVEIGMTTMSSELSPKMLEPFFSKTPMINASSIDGDRLSERVFPLEEIRDDVITDHSGVRGVAHIEFRQVPIANDPGVANREAPPVTASNRGSVHLFAVAFDLRRRVEKVALWRYGLNRRCEFGDRLGVFDGQSLRPRSSSAASASESWFEFLELDEGGPES